MPRGVGVMPVLRMSVASHLFGSMIGMEATNLSDGGVGICTRGRALDTRQRVTKETCVRGRDAIAERRLSVSR